MECRVCNDCWDQIYGTKTPRSPVMSKASPIALVRATETSSGSSSVSSSVATPPDGFPINCLASRPATRRTHTSPRIPTSPLRSSTPIPPAGSVLITDSELSLGELDSYPLRHASKICKANGGGRWEPKPIPEYVAKRIPGCKAAYELELEREEEERRIRRANPVIRDGGQSSRTPLLACMPKANRVLVPSIRLPAALPARDRAALTCGPHHALHLLRSSTLPYPCIALLSRRFRLPPNPIRRHRSPRLASPRHPGLSLAHPRVRLCLCHHAVYSTIIILSSVRHALALCCHSTVDIYLASSLPLPAVYTLSVIFPPPPLPPCTSSTTTSSIFSATTAAAIIAFTVVVAATITACRSTYVFLPRLPRLRSRTLVSIIGLSERLSFPLPSFLLPPYLPTCTNGHLPVLSPSCPVPPRLVIRLK